MDRFAWNRRVVSCQPPFGSFLQSWEWGAFQESLGRVVERVYVERSDGFLLAQAVRMDLPLGQSYWFVPKGPLGTLDVKTMVGLLREHLRSSVFLRIEPLVPAGGMAVADVHPSTSLVVDLTQGTEAILAGMKSKTRYNIRLAGRKGVDCRFVDLSSFDDFVRLLEQTSVRDGIRHHPISYYRRMLEAFDGSGEVQARLAMAFYDDRPLAANILIDFGGQRTYLHGATSNLHRSVMPQYALHWFLIQDAIERSLSSFDFYGVAPEDSGSGHAWEGISRYKKGFGGQVVTTAGTYDFSQRYLFYRMYQGARTLRRLVR